MLNSNINQQVLARSIKDTAFRQELLNSPKPVLVREYNIHFPENVTIRVVEDTPTTLTLALPPQEAAMLELSDSDLEMVAGAQPPSSAREDCP